MRLSDLGANERVRVSQRTRTRNELPTLQLIVLQDERIGLSFHEKARDGSSIQKSQPHACTQRGRNGRIPAVRRVDRGLGVDDVCLQKRDDYDNGSDSGHLASDIECATASLANQAGRGVHPSKHRAKGNVALCTTAHGKREGARSCPSGREVIRRMQRLQQHGVEEYTRPGSATCGRWRPSREYR
jgi:hypothetical protein